ncbi:UNVERIFIED_CONTAM: Lipoxygenase 6, chloroplastic [Sesamum radiatum]|uniref:Lipoxygenase 6, chloroplastic n=1 Tax=Sesamum radiatum TaxID=300843 RepID=A0AAW2MYZ7_SESRA
METRLSQSPPRSGGRRLSPASEHQRLTGKAASFSGFRPSRRAAVIRAVISSGDSKTGVETAEKSVESNGSLVSSSGSGSISVRAVITIRKKMKERLSEKIEDQWESFINGIGRGILIQLISEDIDPEFFLMEVVVHGFSQGPIFFWADTWIHSRKDNPESRIIFKNQAYLPSQTPPGIKDLRHEDLLSLRGNRKEERKLHERVYDYDVYNDLGNPDKSEELARPVAGTEERPYPRRCRTGRPPTLTDPYSETRVEKPHPVYVPRDETFEEIKQNTFSAGRLKALLHNLIPLIVTTLSSSDMPFTNFSDIDKLYNDGVLLKEEEPKEAKKNKILATVMNQMFTVGDKLLKYDLPAIINILAGVNPVNIALLKELPILSKLDPEVYGPPESAITRELIARELHGISVEEAIKEKKLFILDYHDLLLPFIEKMNALPDRKAYASRTVFYYSETGVLRPIVIELSLPPTSSSPRNKYIFTHGHDATTTGSGSWQKLMFAPMMQASINS